MIYDPAWDQCSSFIWINDHLGLRINPETSLLEKQTDGRWSHSLSLCFHSLVSGREEKHWKFDFMV